MDLFDSIRTDPNRVIGWFSCGVTSAVACKLMLADHPGAVVARIVLAGEHEDNERFHAECERWLGQSILRLSPPKYSHHFEVARRERYINGPNGAKCTGALKIATRVAFQRPGDLHVFGFDAGEEDRANDYRDNFSLDMETPLIAAGLTKGDCKAIVERAGIEIPMMYRLGYSNNNCVGCWKGGMGYWNRIRVDFPELFAEAAEICRSIGRSPVKERDGTPIMLHDLDPNRGRFEDDQPPSCGPMCELAINRLEAVR